MVTRCLSYTLAPVKFDILMDLLEDVCDKEKFDTPGNILQRVARAAEGSPRAALTLLSKVHDCEDESEAAALLQMPMDNAEIIDLCRLMIRGDLQWDKLQNVLKGLADTPAETIRIIVVNYINACLLGAKNDRDVPRLLDMLECFLKPGNPSDKMAPLLVAFGRYIYP